MKITMKRFAALVAILGVTALVFGLGTGQADAVAADNTYMTNSFDVEITANENFSFDITENIQVDFAEAHHGIYRYVPLNDSEISNIEVPGYNFDAYKDSGNMVIKIGSGDKYLIGVNDYTISYRLTAYADQDSTMDLLYINMIPTGWQTGISEARASITLPKITDMSSL